METSISIKNDGSAINKTWFNDLFNAFVLDIVPRNSSGVCTDLAGNLGSSTYRWNQIFAAVGFFTVGNVIMHYDYDGTAPIGEGWMLCDGRQVTQSAYDTEHGSGHWASFIGTSPLTNLYLPDMVNSGTGRYPIGANSTQAGTVAITKVGNTSHEINIAHTHSVGTSGSGSQVASGGNNLNTGSSLSSSENIQPDSIAIRFYMRIV